jgi:hypothetical protein
MAALLGLNLYCDVNSSEQGIFAVINIYPPLLLLSCVHWQSGPEFLNPLG